MTNHIRQRRLQQEAQHRPETRSIWVLAFLYVGGAIPLVLSLAAAGLAFWLSQDYPIAAVACGINAGVLFAVWALVLLMRR